MKILMLGWEYPPHIAGGLGMACEGLTKGLSRLGIDITFVVPHLMGDEQASHMHLKDPFAGAGGGLAAGGAVGNVESIRRIGIPAFLKPYWNDEDFTNYLESLSDLQREGLDLAGETSLLRVGGARKKPQEHYGADIFDEIARFTGNVLALLAGESFDIIHAHDWMTFPAGVTLSQLTGKPLVAHIHSVEFDRSGNSAHSQIHQLERLGLQAADAVVAVSHYTKCIVHREYGVPLEKIHVVHNGIYPKEFAQRLKRKEDWQSKIVLFLGRITFQKGPEYFVRAAAKVVPHVPDVLFVMAGDGDMLPRVGHMAHELGVSDHFRFPGFLNGKDVEAMYSAADLYVMPSVSEPFGLTALEAINFDTPVIISKQSGVAEVLEHALKFDFWDVDRLADLIINGLLHEELRLDMAGMAKDELRKLRWDASALRTQEVYAKLQ